MVSSTMKKIGFLSFGHWTPSPQSATRSAKDVLQQSIDLAVRENRITSKEASAFAKFYEEGLSGYTYLEEPDVE